MNKIDICLLYGFTRQTFHNYIKKDKQAIGSTGILTVLPKLGNNRPFISISDMDNLHLNWRECPQWAKWRKQKEQNLEAYINNLKTSFHEQK